MTITHHKIPTTEVPCWDIPATSLGEDVFRFLAKNNGGGRLYHLASPEYIPSLT